MKLEKNSIYLKKNSRIFILSIQPEGFTKINLHNIPHDENIYKAIKKSSPKKKTVSTKKTTSAKKSTVVKKSAPAKKKKTARRSRSKDLLIGTKGGNKYHSATCIVMKKVKKGNVVTFKNSNEALKKGYKPCTVCSIESRD